MIASAFRFCDDLGPKTILYVYQPTVGLKVIVVGQDGPIVGAASAATWFVPFPVNAQT
jgi:hypothetical protein